MVASDLTDARGPSVPDIIRRTLRDLPSDTKRGLGLFLFAWAALLALQIWNQQDQPGARGIAELASGVLGTAGLLLFGLTEVLRRAEEPEVPVVFLPGLRAAAATSPETPALRQLLLALPTLGMLAGALLAAAVAILVLLVWLGTSPVGLAIAAPCTGSPSPRLSGRWDALRVNCTTTASANRAASHAPRSSCRRRALRPFRRR